MRMEKLQVFGNAEAVQGKKIIYLYRLLKEAKTANASGIAFTTENGRTKSKDADTTATKTALFVPLERLKLKSQLQVCFRKVTQ